MRLWAVEEEYEMPNDDLNRNDLNRDPTGRNDVTNRGPGMGGMMIAALGALAVLALVWTWAPWGTRDPQ